MHVNNNTDYMPIEKQNSMYLVILSYAKYLYSEDYGKRNDRLFRIIKELNKMSEKIKPIMFKQKETREWFDFFRKFEIDNLEDEEFSPEMIMFCLLEYMVSVLKYDLFTTKQSSIELNLILKETEIVHKKLYYKTQGIISKFLEIDNVNKYKFKTNKDI